MKHSIKITVILLAMFLITQLIGIFVLTQYPPQTVQITDEQGNIINATSYNLPYGLDPPPEIQKTNIWNITLSFFVIFTISIVLMFILMKYNAELIFRLWFFLVVTLSLGITLNSLTQSFLPYSSLLVLAVSIPLSFLKVFKRNLLVHNLTELLIYPGIAVIFISLILSWTSSPVLAVSIILILISFYDMYAVWHAGFMQKMAKYQIQKLKVFTGFFVPYLSKKQKQALSKSSKPKTKKVKVSVAILGGGDIVFPIILSGVVLATSGIFNAIIISIGATLGLASLFYTSKKGKFYPAMPFISLGCFIALAVAYFI